MVELVIVFLLILLNGLFSMSELAVVSARRARLIQAAERGDTGARAALDLAAEPSRFLSTVQIGITLVGVLTGAFGGATIADRLALVFQEIPPLAAYADAISIGIVVLAISFLTLILGELVPKRLALQHPERIAGMVARPMQTLSRLAGPAAWLLSHTTDLVVRLLGVRKSEEGTVTDEEVKLLMREGAESGHFHDAERAIVEMALRLGDRRVSALMTPRPQIEWVDLNDPPEANRTKILDSHYSRFPVLEGGFDKVLGVLETKDLLGPALAGGPLDLRAQVKPAVYIPDTVPALKAMEQFKQTGTPIAMIVDEYGDIQGLVTLNDLLEALVGDIANPALDSEPHAVQRDDGSWLIDGMVPIDEVKDLVGLPQLPEGDGSDYQTLGGFMMAQLKRIPEAADSVEIDGYRFEVMDMDGRRVDKVLVVPPPPAAA